MRDPEDGPWPGSSEKVRATISFVWLNENGKRWLDFDFSEFQSNQTEMPMICGKCGMAFKKPQGLRAHENLQACLGLRLTRRLFCMG